MKRIVLALAATVALAAPAASHQMASLDGKPIGVEIPPVTRGEMLALAPHRAEILSLASRTLITDEAFRRLLDYVSLQHFVCLGGLVPGSLSDEDSPFNGCSHAEFSALRALLHAMSSMPEVDAQAKALEARLEREIASNPAYAAVCANDTMRFNTGWLMTPEWALVPWHLPTLLTLAGLVALTVAAGMALGRRDVLRRHAEPTAKAT